jgi:hypothetical protein
MVNHADRFEQIKQYFESEAKRFDANFFKWWKPFGALTQNEKNGR